MSDRVPWWKSSVVYQIYPRSFADANLDGIGDIAGIRKRLDHLAWLGVDALWLSPIFTSPMADFGYDVADYCDVDPLFGTLAELDALIGEAHASGIRLLLDLVPNHTSDRHPWFLESRSSSQSPRRDWYVWRDPAPGGGPPNNWVAVFSNGAPAWTLDPASGQYYLHSFLPAQPDLNWDNPQVVEAMHAVVRFWLDRGVDGFRVDAVTALGKDPALPDDPPQHAGLPHALVNDHPGAHVVLRGLRRVVDAYAGDRMLVVEVFRFSGGSVASYYGRNDEAHLAFDLPKGLLVPWEAGEWRRRIDDVMQTLVPSGAWPTWVLSNHDLPRHRTRHGSATRAGAAAVLLLTLPGTPFLYAGEELGLEDAVVPRERVVDPGGRDGCRAPIPWDASPAHGWGPTPWLPWPPEPEQRNVASLRQDADSILNLYRRLLAARRGSPALRLGELAALPAPDGVVAYQRRLDSDRRVVLVNFTQSELPCPAAGTVEVSTARSAEGAPFDGFLGPDQAVVVRHP
jgi:alpha-glucosidase